MTNSRNLFRLFLVMLLLGAAAATVPGPAPRAAADQAATAKDEADCKALMNVPNLTILSAEITEAKGSTPAYCHVTGLIAPAIHWHMQLPLPSQWNGRLLNIGNGGKAGNLVFSDERLAAGYAVANSNTGHDNGSEPNSSFAANLEEAIDFGYRAVHVTATASKTLTKAYYGKAPQYAYFEGCSTGGRQGMMEAQRYPYDFDGIVIGAAVIDYQRINMEHVWSLQRMTKEHFAGSLAFDTSGDGSYPSLAKLDLLRKAVLDKCDALDGVKDGVIDDPLKCNFNPEVDLASKACPGDKNGENCFTRMQMQTIKQEYEGPRDSKGTLIIKGLAPGSEFAWGTNVIPYGGNKFSPSHMGYEVDHVNFLFFEHSPGVSPAGYKDPNGTVLDKKAVLPEYAWWEFNMDDVTNGKGDFMMKITDALDPDLSRFVSHAKMIQYQGWGDADAYPQVATDYYKAAVAATFKGDYTAAQQKYRLFMAPGMGHCGGGPGPNEWDKLPPLVDWVEKGKAPDYLVAVHRSNARGAQAASAPVDNERKLCPYPAHEVYVGPAGGQNDPKNWVEKNFVCKTG